MPRRLIARGKYNAKDLLRQACNIIIGRSWSVSRQNRIKDARWFGSARSSDDSTAELTLADIDSFYTYTAQVLSDLRQHSKFLTDEEFAETVDQDFTTVLSNGEVVILCDNGRERLVQKDSIEEFIELVLKARSNEANEHIKAIQAGISTVL